jgi:hypothetical protein
MVEFFNEIDPKRAIGLLHISHSASEKRSFNPARTKGGPRM